MIFPALGSNTSSAVRSWLPSRLWLGCKTIAPPPKAAGTQQSHQDYAYDCYPDYPANCQFRNQDKDEQQNYAGDDEDGGESHGSSVDVDYSINSGSPAFWFFMVMLDSNNDNDFASNLVDYTVGKSIQDAAAYPR